MTPELKGQVTFQDLNDRRDQDRAARRWLIGIIATFCLVIGGAVITSAMTSAVADAEHEKDIQATKDRVEEVRDDMLALRATVVGNHVETMESLHEIKLEIQRER